MQACAAVPALARNKAPRDLARSLKRPLNPDAQACPPPPTNQMPAFSGQVLLRERASCTIPARGPFPWLAPSRTTERCTLSRQRVHRAPNLGYLCRTARHCHTPSLTLAPFFRLLRLVCLADVSSALFNLQHSLSLFLISRFGPTFLTFDDDTNLPVLVDLPFSFISHSVLIAQLSFLGASESAPNDTLRPSPDLASSILSISLFLLPSQESGSWKLCTNSRSGTRGDRDNNSWATRVG